MLPRRTWPDDPPPVPVVEDLEAAVEGLEPDKLALLVGAGVSMSPPSGLPSASGFLEALYEACLPSGFDLRSADLRFESVLDAIRHRFDEELRVLDLFESTQPNANHVYLRSLADRGALIITTNFDQLVERAAPRDSPLRIRVSEEDYAEFLCNGLSGDPEIWHLHGVLKDFRTKDNQRDTIVASIRDCWVSKNLFHLDAKKGRALQKVLSERDLLVVGYSGSDDYDIAPALEGIRSDRRLLWVQHSREGRGSLTPDDLLEKERNGDRETWYRSTSTNVLAAITDGKRAAESVRLILGDTEDLLRRVSGITVAEPPEDPPLLDLAAFFEIWGAEYLPTAADRYLLTMRLCRIGGLDEQGSQALGAALEALSQGSGLPPNNELRSRVEILLAAVEKGLINPAPLADVASFVDVLNREPVLKAGLLYSLGAYQRENGDLEESIAVLRESLAIRRRIGFLADVDAAEHGLATSLFVRGFPDADFDEAISHATRGLRTAEDADHPEGITCCHTLLARIAERRAEVEWEHNPVFDAPSAERIEQLSAATEHYRAAAEAAFHSGIENLIASTAGEFGLFLWREGDFAQHGEAARQLARAYRIHERDRDWSSLLIVGSSLALCLASRDPRRSTLAHGQVYKAARRLGREDVASLALQFVKGAAPGVIDPLRVSVDSDDRFVFSVVNYLTREGVEI